MFPISASADGSTVNRRIPWQLRNYSHENGFVHSICSTRSLRDPWIEKEFSQPGRCGVYTGTNSPGVILNYNGAKFQCCASTPDNFLRRTWVSLPFLTCHLASTCSQLPRQPLTPTDHPSGSSTTETLDTFLSGPCALLFHQAASSWGWGLVSICGCGVSSTGLAGSYVYFRSAQEEGTGNSVGEGLAFRDRKCFLLGTPPRAGHRPRPLLFVWAQQRLLFWWPSSSPLWEIWWVSPGGPFRDGKSLHTPHSLWLGRRGCCKSLGCSARALAELLDQVSPDSSFMFGSNSESSPAGNPLQSPCCPRIIWEHSLTTEKVLGLTACTHT